MGLLSNTSLENGTPSSFQDRFKQIERIVIIYPEHQKWLRIAKYTLGRLYNLPESFDFLILQAPAAVTESALENFEFAEMDYSPNKETREDLRERIAGFNPDVLFQLEPDPSERYIKLLASMEINLKIGFGPENSGLDIVYAQKKTGFYEKNILNLIALIDSPK